MFFPVFIFLFTGVVFSKETGVIKRDGETVTLYINKTLSSSKNYLWTFGHPNPLTAIAVVTNGEVTPVNGTRFANRLHTDKDTGSITISNLSISDSGIFLAQVLTKTGILLQRFNLTVQDNYVIPLNVLKGNNITLDTGVDEVQKDQIVKWTQGRDFGGKLIAGLEDFIISVEKSFEGIIQLNPHDGSLTIIRVTQNYAGFYCVKMLLHGQPYILKQYLITVFEPVSTPNISHSLEDERCLLNCSVRNDPEVTLSWYRGEREITNTSNRDVTIDLSLPLEIDSQNEGIYSCVVANPVSKEAVPVNSTQWCPAHDPKGTPYGWIAGVVIVVAVVVLMFVLWMARQRQKEGAQNCFSMGIKAEDTSSQRSKVSEDRIQTGEQKGLLTKRYGSFSSPS